MRRCKATTRAGKPCSAAPLRDGDFCLAHADAETRRSVGFVSANGKGGRHPIPKPTDLARRIVEQHACALLRPHFKALGLHLNDDATTRPLPTGAIVVHQGVATDIEDLGAQIAAAERLLDRVYGRPRQQTEISGPDGGPIALVAPSDDVDRSTRAAQLLAAAGALDEPLTDGNGNGSNGRH